MNEIKEAILRKIRPWCVDDIIIEADTIRISGWLVRREGSDQLPVIASPSADLIDADFNLPRPDLEKVFPFWKDASDSGFSCTFHPRIPSFNGEYRFSYPDPEDSSDHCLRDYAYLIEEHLPFPDAKSRLRVHGSDSLSSFKLEGYSTYLKLKEIFYAKTGIDIGDFSRVLDWGCGCGRVSRYLEGSQCELWGADIDPLNLEWCSQYLEMKTLRLKSKPTGILQKSFYELIFGISVMTHLKEDMQKLWIGELANSLKPGGYIAVSVHGKSSALRNIPNSGFREFLVNGFYDFGPNSILLEAVPDDQSYHDTYNCLEQVAANWCSDLRIVGFYESTIGNHQDMILLQKPL